MLALIATQMPDPAVEAADRDPGLITLAIAIVRNLRRRAGSGHSVDGKVPVRPA